jgi:branched-chain amino acid transport system ATP-binding protein
MSILQLARINTFYGLSHILFDISLEIKKGEMVCLLGRNGAGKSTTLKSIMGLVSPRSGSIKFSGREINGVQAHRIARLGLGYVPEDRIIFPDLSVRENLEMGIKGKYREDGEWTFEKVYHIFPILKERKEQRGGTLSGGEQQMLTIARTLMGNPVVILLDEPSEGLAPLVTKEVYEQVTLLKERGITILLCEQNASVSLSIADRAYILEKGQISWEGYSEELKSRPEIMKQYLGV